ncbi:DNA mismatch repair endonuclease MutL [Mangrovibacterium diazotrophicum]|uniref:DNA mismatch repair protein MutL n=1 Tax=Mangrovibacterium diazotrophicum TaxID=1261403 RepID=A0A419WB59_9BACT|nr:DNA mismatch repair endonuclease MutL [Mangrovibacterium diazotrophicum]RKD92720.1 DNA mismatch repair protein MutL [Mangrovibacterium diazotrophicum]
MPDIIQLLPDAVANQIAAGEVIQRPASVVKELVENAIDAGATQITLNIKDAGRTLIQVSDNGCGMSETDARMAFERHATSKIRSANDLFCIRTMGFRGEALASIAAIADVELNTKQHEAEVGVFIHMVGSKVLKQEATQCANGTNFLVKNLFFNVPARRKFLKANSTELKHIINEVQRIALANPEIGLSLIHNQDPIYEMAVGDNIRKRIVSIFGKSINQNLVPVNTETSLVKIKGFIGQPKYARKTYGEQFFFVNNRFMKHPFFHRAIMQAYEKILAPDSYPSYFLYLDVDPECIDINIHPTKTEIKFENETAIWQIIQASVREALGKFNVMPSIDFDQAGSIEIPIAPKSREGIEMPKIQVDPTYNPFNVEVRNYPSGGGGSNSHSYSTSKHEQVQHWEKLYSDFTKSDEDEETQTEVMMQQEEEPANLSVNHDSFNTGRTCFQFKNKFILTPVKSGLMVIDQKRAHERILFENFMAMLAQQQIASQQLLFPHTFELEASDSELLRSVLTDLKALGFDVKEAEANHFVVNGIPGILENHSPLEIIESMLEDLKNTAVDMQEKAREQIAAALACASAIPYGHLLKVEELNQLIDQLFACTTPNFSPTGKQVLTIMPVEQFEKLLK